MQPPPRVPPNPTDYTGSYAAEIEPDTQVGMSAMMVALVCEAHICYPMCCEEGGLQECPTTYSL